MIKVTVDRSRWITGREVKSLELCEESYLCRPRDQKMCCLGFAALELGFTLEEIEGVQTPGSFLRGYRKSQVGRWPKCFANMLAVTDPRGAGLSVEASDLMSVNDSCKLNDETREDKVRKLGLQLGIEFEFVGQFENQQETR